jgi:hypothetical protein
MELNYKLTKQLFEKCAYRSDYEAIGNDVDYKFDVDGSHLYIYFQGSKDIKADKGWIDWRYGISRELWKGRRRL